MSETPDVKYSSYTAAQKKASQLYRLKNKEKINEQRKKYYQTKKANDPTFLEYKRIKAKEYYEKKKLDKVIKPEATPEETKIEEHVTVPESIEMKMPDVIKEAIQSPLPEPDVTPLEEPAKRKRSTKSKSKK
jgi:hypothetical protein